MSYKQPARNSKRATVFYPNILKVYEYANPLSQEMEPVFKNTQPYSKAIQGKTKREIDSYLGHVIDNYTKQRDAYVKDGLKKAEDENLKRAYKVL